MNSNRPTRKVITGSRLFKENTGDIKLHKMLDEIDIERIHQVFLKEESGELDIDQLKKVLSSVTKTTFDQKLFEVIFLRMNMKR